MNYCCYYNRRFLCRYLYISCTLCRTNNFWKQIRALNHLQDKIQKKAFAFSIHFQRVHKFRVLSSMVTKEYVVPSDPNYCNTSGQPTYLNEINIFIKTANAQVIRHS